MESIDIKLICRLCAREDEFCIEVYGEDGVKNNISKKIRLCLPIAIKEDDEYPKQICLSCLNKLDTSYELYSGCMNAQNTIKRLLKNFTNTEHSRDLMQIESPVEQIQFTTQKQLGLSRSKPFMKFGKTVVSLQEVSSKRSNEPIPDSRLKVMRLQGERDVKNLQVDSDDSTTVGSPLHFPPLDNDDETTQVNVPEQVLPTGNLSSYTVAPSGQVPVMFVAGNVDTVPSSRQQFVTSGIVSAGKITTNAETQFLGTARTNPSIGTQLVSTSSSGLPTTLNELSGTLSQYVIPSSVINSATSVMVQQLRTQNALGQAQVYIPDPPYSSPAVECGGSTANSLSPANALVNQTLVLTPAQHKMLQQNSQTHKSQQSILKGKAKNHQHENMEAYFSGPLRTRTNPRILKPKISDTLLSNNATQNGLQNVLIATSNVLSQTMYSGNTPANLKGKISAKTISQLQMPVGEARTTVTLDPVMHTNHPMYVSTISNSSPLGVNQQAMNLEAQHLSSSGHSAQVQGVNSDAIDTSTTNAVTTTISTTGAMTAATYVRVPVTVAPNLRTSTTHSIVTPTASPLIGVGLRAAAPAIASPTVNAGMPLTRIEYISPISSSNMLTANVSTTTIGTLTPIITSAYSTGTSITSSASNTVISDSVFTAGTVTPPSSPKIKEQAPDSPVVIEESSESSDNIRDVTNTVSSDVTICTSTSSPSTPTLTVSTSHIESVTEADRKHLCQYCNKMFPESIIVHHRKLHFRQRFFSCIACGKNFRTEVGLENHRCEEEEDSAD